MRAAMKDQLTIPVPCPTNIGPPTNAWNTRSNASSGSKEKRGLSEDIRDVYNDVLRAAGYDTKCVRQIVRLRRMKPEDRRQMEAILDVYKNALRID
jgi:uncharacterized protein (UPF0335 family)